MVQGTLSTNPATCGGTPFWDEDFTFTNGTENDAGATPWSEVSDPSNLGQVQGNRYRFRNGGVSPGAIVQTGTINISGLLGISLQMDIRSDPQDDLENNDFLILEYRVDGGSWAQFDVNGNNAGNFSSGGFITASDNSVVTGSTLEIRARAISDANNEAHFIDNIQVACTSQVDPNCIPPLAPPTFTEVAANTGFPNVAANRLNVGGNKDGGTAWGDFNQDNCLDLLVNTEDDGTQLFQSNCDGTFFRVPNGRVPAELGNDERERSVIWGDINNDGFLDFARNTSGAGGGASIHFYLNEANPPDNSFILIQTVCNGVDNGFNGGIVTAAQQNDIDNGRLVDGQNTEGLGWLDYNNDGFLDLVIENHNHGIDIMENQFYRGAANVLTAVPQNVDCNHNSNPPTNYPPFMHVTADEDPKGLITGAVDGDYMTIGDYNNDGYLDILGRKQNARDLFQNDGNNNFPFNPSFNGEANNDNKGGVMFCDLDSDGDFDIMWTDGGNNTNPGNQNFVWMQTGLYSENFIQLDGSNATTRRNPINFIAANHNIDGCACGDIDNDGDMDMFLSSSAGAGYMIRNDGVDANGVPILVDNTAAYNINVNANGEGVNLVDYDNDGDLDLYVNVNDGNNQLWRNNLLCPKNNLKVEALVCIEPGLYREAIGTTIRIEEMGGGGFQSALQDVNSAKGHGSQNPLKVPFGIPDNNGLYRVIVRFPPFNVDLDGVNGIENPNTNGDNETISETYTIENIRPTDFPDQTIRITSRFAINGATDCNGGLLPVEMLYFTGEQLISGEVLLKWGTVWERDNEKFVVERSENATNFEAIGELQSKGENSTSVLAYEFLDREIPSKTVYYRLRQVDKDGTISFSKVVSITPKEGIVSGIEGIVYPSPNAQPNDFLLKYDSKVANQTLTLRVYNAIGQEVLSLQYELKRGINEIIIPSTNLPKGLLIAEWITPLERNSQKIILE